MQNAVTTTGCGVTYYRGCFRAAMAWPRVSQERTVKAAPLLYEMWEGRGEVTQEGSLDESVVHSSNLKPDLAKAIRQACTTSGSKSVPPPREISSSALSMPRAGR